MAIFAFYSLKGGSSRTTLAANLAAYLARTRLLRIGLVDADFEGSGMDVFLAIAPTEHLQLHALVTSVGPALSKTYTETLNGTVVDAIAGEVGQANGRYWLSVGGLYSQVAKACEWPEEGYWEVGDRLWVMPCGREYGKIGTLTYDRRHVRLLRQLIDRMQRDVRLDHVFVDCRSGIADSAMAAALCADCLVMVVCPTNAHLLGSVDGTRMIRDAVSLSCLYTATQSIHYVAAKVPVESCPGMASAVTGFFAQSLFDCAEEPRCSVIPFHPGMLLSERIPCLSEPKSPADNTYTDAVAGLWDDLCLKLKGKVLLPALP